MNISVKPNTIAGNQIRKRIGCSYRHVDPQANRTTCAAVAKDYFSRSASAQRLIAGQVGRSCIDGTGRASLRRKYVG